jgi:hypothetical protein
MKRNIAFALLLLANIVLTWINFQMQYKQDQFMDAVELAIDQQGKDLGQIIDTFSHMSGRLARLERQASSQPAEE